MTRELGERTAFPWLPHLRWQVRRGDQVEYRVEVSDPSEHPPLIEWASSTWQTSPAAAWSNLAMVVGWWTESSTRTLTEPAADSQRERE